MKNILTIHLPHLLDKTSDQIYDMFDDAKLVFRFINFDQISCTILNVVKLSNGFNIKLEVDSDESDPVKYKEKFLTYITLYLHNKDLKFSIAEDDDIQTTKYQICFKCIDLRGNHTNIYEELEIPSDLDLQNILYWIDEEFDQSDFMERHEIGIILNYYVDEFDKILEIYREALSEDTYVVLVNTYMKILMENQHLVDSLSKSEILKIALSATNISYENSINLLKSIRENVDKKVNDYMIDLGVTYPTHYGK